MVQYNETLKSIKIGHGNKDIFYIYILLRYTIKRCSETWLSQTSLYQLICLRVWLMQIKFNKIPKLGILFKVRFIQDSSYSRFGLYIYNTSYSPTVTCQISSNIIWFQSDGHIMFNDNNHMIIIYQSLHFTG